MQFWKFSVAALAVLVASTIAPVAQAQVKITGGNGTITGGRIFVPTTGRFISPSGAPDRGSEQGSLLYNGTYNSVFIKTELGNLPTKLQFRANLVPSFNTSAGEAPIVGTTGEISGLVSFRAFNNANRPVFYTNIPTQLNIALTKVPCPVCSTPTTEWNAFDYRLTEVGVGATPSSRTVVTRETDVRLLQYQSTGTNPTDRTVLGNSIPASAYNVRREGISYGGDVQFDIKSGTFGDGNISTTRLIEIITNPTNPTNPNPTNPNPTTEKPTTEKPIVIGYLPVVITTLRGSDTTWYTIPTTVYNPMLDQEVRIIVRGRTKPKPDKTSKPDERKDNKKDDKKTEEVEIDTEEIVFVDRKTEKTYTTVGLPSRVFPNFMGLEEVDLKKD